jgi:hypothetical protein
MAKYQSPDDVDETAIISMRMLPSRPLDWAVGTDFDPLWDDKNQIALKLTVDSKAELQHYGQLVQWMKHNVNSGEATSITAVQAEQLWADIEVYGHHHLSSATTKQLQQ